VSEVAGLGANVYGVDKDTVDVTDSAAVASLVERTGPVDVLVNNARGVAGQVLVSADVSWITGQVISIDGGQSIF
jgi:NAD(P)-dependent dehydrogenase (short-subunit alcohol dehydrogenase family)